MEKRDGQARGIQACAKREGKRGRAATDGIWPWWLVVGGVVVVGTTRTSARYCYLGVGATHALL